MSSKIPNIKLNNYKTIPALGFGTFENAHSGEMHDAVIAALDAGYRHLDCAWYYKNESEVGSAIKTWFSNNPTVRREELFITTKVWPHLMTPSDINFSIRSSLQKLGLDYVDAFLIHWPVVAEKNEELEVKLNEDGGYILLPNQDTALQTAWQTMESIQTSGLAHTIGVSNFRTHHLAALLSSPSLTITPAINQIEINPYFPNTSLINYCTSHSILPVAYSPLGSQGQSGKKPTPIADPMMEKLAKEKGCSVAQLCIAWGIKRGYPVLPKSANMERLKSNFELVELSEEEMEKINGVAGSIGKKNGLGVRMVNPIGMFGFNLWEGEEDQL